MIHDITKTLLISIKDRRTGAFVEREDANLCVVSPGGREIRPFYTQSARCWRLHLNESGNYTINAGGVNHNALSKVIVIEPRRKFINILVLLDKVRHVVKEKECQSQS